MTGTLPEPTCKLSWFSDPNSCSYMRIFCNQCGYIGRTERLVMIGLAFVAGGLLVGAAVWLWPYLPSIRVVWP